MQLYTSYFIQTLSKSEYSDRTLLEKKMCMSTIFFIITSALCFFVYGFTFTVWDHLFFPDRRTFFTISCKASLITTRCLSFWLFGNAFISPLFLKISFAGYRILG